MISVHSPIFNSQWLFCLSQRKPTDGRSFFYPLHPRISHPVDSTIFRRPQVAGHSFGSHLVVKMAAKLGCDSMAGLVLLGMGKPLPEGGTGGVTYGYRQWLASRLKAYFFKGTSSFLLKEEDGGLQCSVFKSGFACVLFSSFFVEGNSEQVFGHQFGESQQDVAPFW